MLGREPHHVVIMQPYFLPYRNYFGLIRRCDEFVFFDDVQFCRKWQQRNCVPDGRGGKEWLTVPVVSRRPLLQRICDVEMLPDSQWRRQMVRRIRKLYSRHPNFNEVFPSLIEILLAGHQRLVDLNIALLQWSAALMGLPEPRWHLSSEIHTTSRERNERLIEICSQLGATHYVCGTAAQVYLQTELFAQAGVEVIWHEEQYVPYPQLGNMKFDHFVSGLDLLMNNGSKSYEYLRPLV
ncbi:MAG: WbqC family protein [Acidobacteriota bacterium]|nr:WbqC family protein [Acidobacteriota bacterium]